MVVLEASAAIDLLVEREPNRALLDRLAATGQLHAPHLIDVEVLGVLRRLVARGQLEDSAASMARRTFAELDVLRYPHEPLAERIWALRGQLTVYDAAYVALAEHLEVPLVTADGRLARATGHTAVVESFARGQGRPRR